MCRYIIMSATVADPYIFSRGATSCDGSRHSTSGSNLICFSVGLSHIYYFVGGGPKSIAKLNGAIAGFASLWICHWSAMGQYAYTEDAMWRTVAKHINIT